MKLSSLRHSVTEDVEAISFVGGIYPRRHLSILASAAGVGKTWLMTAQALNLSAGGYVFGSTSPFNKPAKTLIFCGETGIEILIERAHLLQVNYNPENIAIYASSDLAANDIAFCLDDEVGFSNIKKIIQGENPDLVFFDTLISFRSDDENASQNTSKILTKLRGVADTMNCAIVLNHHIRKRKQRDMQTELTQDDIIGSSAITRLCAVAFILEKAPGDLIKTVCVKSWWKKPEAYYWGIKSVSQDEVTLIATVSADMTRNRLLIHDIIESAPQGAMFTSQDIAQAASCSEDTARTYLNRLVDEGILIRLHLGGNTVHYSLSAKNSE